MGAFGNGNVHLETARGPKNAKQKIGERPVLIFGVENRVGGNVCEALLEPTHVALPPMLHL